MAPKKRRSADPEVDPNGMFAGMTFFFVRKGVQPRRIQIWIQKVLQMGGVIEEHLSKRVTHVLADSSKFLLQEVDSQYVKSMKTNVLSFQWLEESLKLGHKGLEDSYRICLENVSVSGSNRADGNDFPETTIRNDTHGVLESAKRSKPSIEDASGVGSEDQKKDKIESNEKLSPQKEHYPSEDEIQKSSSAEFSDPHNPQFDTDSTATDKSTSAQASYEDSSLLYKPPDLNRNVTEIFGKLINIYRALGDDRRSFSYYKAIPVIEKLPFKIRSGDEVKHLPAIGKAMQDHIHEIVTTGNLSKLEHFEKDEKVKTVSLFGEVWGIGPATALKLYEKGHRTLHDLEQDTSLTNAQRLGVKYFDDIKKRIPRDEVKEMEKILKKSGEDILPEVTLVCGGSYRRGKANCGDLDIVITHPDGKSHKGFLPKFVKYLKDIKFLREDLVFSTHSMEGTDSGVDTYFGLCTYPGQETRHRIDLKVYPRDIYAFGLIAWTGNDVLNRRLRLLAESKGFRLDDTGLYLLSHSPTGKKVAKSNTRLSCRTEKEVFDVLGFPWLEPHERNL